MGGGFSKKKTEKSATSASTNQPSRATARSVSSTSSVPPSSNVPTTQPNQAHAISGSAPSTRVTVPSVPPTQPAQAARPAAPNTQPPAAASPNPLPQAAVTTPTTVAPPPDKAVCIVVSQVKALNSAADHELLCRLGKALASRLVERKDVKSKELEDFGKLLKKHACKNVSKCTCPQRCYFFYTGHGSQPNENQRRTNQLDDCIHLMGADQKSSGNGVSMKVIAQKIRDTFPHSRELHFFLSACRSSSGDFMGPSQPTTQDGDQQYVPHSVVVYSSKPGQKSTTGPDGSPFAHALYELFQTPNFTLDHLVGNLAAKMQKKALKLFYDRTMCSVPDFAFHGNRPEYRQAVKYPPFEAPTDGLTDTSGNIALPPSCPLTPKRSFFSKCKASTGRKLKAVHRFVKATVNKVF